MIKKDLESKQAINIETYLRKKKLKEYQKEYREAQKSNKNNNNMLKEQKQKLKEY